MTHEELMELDAEIVEAFEQGGMDAARKVVRESGWDGGLSDQDIDAQIEAAVEASHT